MTIWICKEVHTDNGGYIEPIRKLTRCEDCNLLKEGVWIPYLKEGLRFKCSRCGSRFNLAYKYCPRCGAKMEEE